MEFGPDHILHEVIFDLLHEADINNHSENTSHEFNSGEDDQKVQSKTDCDPIQQMTGTMESCMESTFESLTESERREEELSKYPQFLVPLAKEEFLRFPHVSYLANICPADCKTHRNPSNNSAQSTEYAKSLKRHLEPEWTVTSEIKGLMKKPLTEEEIKLKTNLNGRTCCLPSLRQEYPSKTELAADGWSVGDWSSEEEGMSSNKKKSLLKKKSYLQKKSFLKRLKKKSLRKEKSILIKKSLLKEKEIQKKKEEDYLYSESNIPTAKKQEEPSKHFHDHKAQELYDFQKNELDEDIDIEEEIEMYHYRFHVNLDEKMDADGVA